MAKKSKEIWKTYNNVFDQFTHRNLFKLASQGFFEELKSPISIGKEANIFSAVKKDNSQVIVKIYRLETVDFNKMYDYIKSDPRFINLKKSRRRIIFAWCQREFRNLLKAREAGVRTPTPYVFKDNILVMEFIGDNEVALKLKDSNVENPEKFFKEVIDNMKKLYDKELVHGDLSHFNILNYKNKPVFIDFSQACTLNDPNSIEYLKRDIRNIVKYFKKIGVKSDEETIFKKITNKKV